MGNLQSSLLITRSFADDAVSSTSSTVLDAEKEKETTAITEQTEQFEMPPIRPTYQTKTPMELIAEVPIIEVDAQFLKCDGLWFESDMTPRRTDIMRHPKEGHPT